MKKSIFVLALFGLCLGLASCEDPTKGNNGNVLTPTDSTSTPVVVEKVVTSDASDITSSSATLSGLVKVDIVAYKSIEFGVMYSADLQEMNGRKGAVSEGDILTGEAFSVTLNDLDANTTYYYCAFVFLNGVQYEYGEIKNFTTSKVTETPTPNGAFSVSATQKVKFSQGNLRYTQSTDTWSFAEHQYDMLGEANVTADGNLADVIDLFGWSGSTGSAKWGISISDDYYNDYSGEFVDWGKNIGNGTTWRTLTDDEWFYLLCGRANASDLQGVARLQINNSEYVNGLILLPDTWTCPKGVSFRSGFASDYSVQAYADYQTFTLKEWNTLEQAGAVVLPASGSRGGSDVDDVRDDGDYCSATPYATSYASCLYFYSFEANFELQLSLLRASRPSCSEFLTVRAQERTEKHSISRSGCT